jgi:hypothetical protein
MGCLQETAGDETASNQGGMGHLMQLVWHTVNVQLGQCPATPLLLPGGGGGGAQAPPPHLHCLSWGSGGVG